MTNTPQPELFTNVHKGIRRALFNACVQLGSAAGDPGRERRALACLGEALHFVAHHGENEDLLLLPLLRERAPEVFARLSAAHAALDEARAALSTAQPLESLYLAACSFTSQYLAHMDEEERALAPDISRILSADEASDFARRSVERTPPADQRMMLGWMLPAMSPGAVEAFVGRLPPTLAAEMRSLASPAAG